ncbi:DUF2164 domain-containing protein [Rhodocaloribacter sp.]
MAIELRPEVRKEALASLMMYVEENMDEPIGNIAAGGLLDFFLREIGPSVYNKAVSDVQERLHMRIMELDLEVYEEEFPYRQKVRAKRKRG